MYCHKHSSRNSKMKRKKNLSFLSPSGERIPKKFKVQIVCLSIYSISLHIKPTKTHSKIMIL